MISAATQLPNASPSAASARPLPSAGSSLAAEATTRRETNDLGRLLDGVLAELVRMPPTAERPRTSGDRRLDLPPPLSEQISTELRALILEAGGDPMLLIGLLQSAQHEAQVDRGIQGAQTGGERSEAAALEREQAIEKAMKKAARKNRIPRWLRKLLKAVATIAATAVAVVSGGAGAVALAGIVLLLAAPHLGKLAEKLGMDPDNAAWLTRGFQLVGAAMSLGAGLAQVSASAIETATLEVIASVSEFVQTAVEASQETANAVFDFQSSNALGAAAAARVRGEAADMDVEQAMEVLREGLESAARSIATEEDLLRIRAEARQAVLANGV